MIDTESVAMLRPSKSNPRKTFPGDAELVASIKAHGILQPLIVRENGVMPEREIVVGERRWRAAKKAGLAEVPVIVRALNNEQVLELQLTENIQRADVHPVEEAEGYEGLQKMGRSVEQIAAKIGKSPSYVRETLQLASLCAAGKGLYLEGALTKTGAFKIARLPTKAQEVAIADLKRTHRQDDKEPFAVRVVEEVVSRRYLPLAKAPFDTKDAQLVPKAGACTACPSNTAVKPELFAEVKSATCTNPDCYRGKVDADWAKKAAAAEAQGQAVMPDKKAKQVFGQYGLQSPDYIDLERTEWDGSSMKSWKQILGKDAPATTLAKNPHTGEVHELVDAKEARAVKRRKEAKKDRAAPAKGKKAKNAESGQRGEADLELLARVGTAAVDACLAAAEKKGTLLVLRLVAEDVAADVAPELLRRLDLKNEKELLTRLPKLTEAEMRAVVVGNLLCESAHPLGWGACAWDEGLVKVAKAYGVDLKALEKTERAKAAEAAPAPAKKGGRK